MNVKGIIGVPSSEFGRYAICAASVIGVQRPPQTAILPVFGANIAENRNTIADQAIQSGAEWVLYVDDDQVLPPDTLTRLLAHNKDIVSGLYLKRQHPFEPVMYNREDERNFCYPKLLTPFSGSLVEVKATGAGCLLVKTRVFHKMTADRLAGDGKEWWQLGQIIKSGWCDDIDFCRRARLAGFSVWCDLEARVGHQINGTIWPVKNESGAWFSNLVQGKGVIAQWEAASDYEQSETLDLASA